MTSTASQATRNAFRWNPYGTDNSTTVVPVEQEIVRDIVPEAPEEPKHIRNMSSGSCRHLFAHIRGDSCGLTMSSAPQTPRDDPLGPSPAVVRADNRSPTNGWEIINKIRVEATDDAVAFSVSQLSQPALNDILAALGAYPTLFADLCRNDRGNVIVQLMQFFRGYPGVELLYDSTLQAFDELATTQCGAIAITRIFDLAHDSFRHAAAARVLADVERLATDPYGNFIVSQVVRHCCTCMSNSCVQLHSLKHQLSSRFEDGGFVIRLALNKFGSHVLEQYIHDVPSDWFQQFAEVLLNSNTTIRALGTHAIGNYPLQATLRRMAHERPQRARQLAPQVTSATKGSRYAINIHRSLAGQARRRQ